MTRYVLDSNAVSDIFDGVEPITSRAGAYPRGVVFTTAITVEESLSGWYRYLRNAKQPTAVEKAYDGLVTVTLNFGKLSILPYNVAGIARYEALLRMKLNVRKDDLRIAAIALIHNATVVTANARDFARVPGLSVEDWTQPAA
jgi:tRNA(fMet)-specific endonuclease VapC